MAAPKYLWSAQDIAAKLISRLNLVATPLQTVENPMLISPIVQPVTAVDELLRTQKLLLDSLRDPGGIGVATIFTVPKGQRWWLRSLRVVRSAGVTITTNAIALSDGVIASAANIVAYTTALDKTIEFAKLTPVPENWVIGTSVDAYAAGDKINTYLYYELELLF